MTTISALCLAAPAPSMTRSASEPLARAATGDRAVGLLRCLRAVGLFAFLAVATAVCIVCPLLCIRGRA